MVDLEILFQLRLRLQLVLEPLQYFKYFSYFCICPTNRHHAHLFSFKSCVKMYCILTVHNNEKYHSLIALLKNSFKIIFKLSSNFSISIYLNSAEYLSRYARGYLHSSSKSIPICLACC